MRCYVNGVQVLSQGGMLATIAGCQNMGQLGRGHNNNTFYAGDIAEVLVYDRALSDAERQSLEGYLQGKHFGPLWAAPQISAIATNSRSSIRIEQLPDGQIRCRVIGEPNQAYQVLASLDLMVWAPLLTQTTAADGTFEFSVGDSSSNSRQFFRARAVSE